MWHGAQQQSGARGGIPGGVDVATAAAGVAAMVSGSGWKRAVMVQNSGGAEQWRVLVRHAAPRDEEVPQDAAGKFGLDIFPGMDVSGDVVLALQERRQDVQLRRWHPLQIVGDPLVVDQP